MKSLSIGIMLLFNQGSFTTTLYVNDVYILNISRPINQDSSAIRYALYLLNEEKIILTGATEPSSQVLPLVPFSQTWGLEGIIDLEANTTGEFKSVQGLECVSFEEKKSFPPLLSPERMTRVIQYWVCSKKAFANQIGYSKAIPYLPITRKKLTEPYTDYELVLASYMISDYEELGMDIQQLSELEAIEKVAMPMEIIEEILAKPAKKEKE